MERATLSHRNLWSNIEARLDLGPVRWRGRIEEFGQVRAVEDRSADRIWSDDEVFRELLLAMLSSNTVWSTVERVQADLKELFCDFSLEAYASHSDSEIDSRFVPWFKDRRAGSLSLRGGLVNLIRAARILLQYSKCHGAAVGYFTSLGVALAAEALKNLGFDVAKPDRHMMRAVGSFGLVRFNRWRHSRGRRGVPESTSRTKLLEVMTVAEQIAEAAEASVVFVDNAIWLLCAKDELYLTNPELAAIAHQSRPRTTVPLQFRRRAPDVASGRLPPPGWPIVPVLGWASSPGAAPLPAWLETQSGVSGASEHNYPCPAVRTGQRRSAWTLASSARGTGSGPGWHWL